MTVNEDYFGTEGMDTVDSSIHVTYADYFTNKFHRYDAYFDEDGAVPWTQVLEGFVEFLSGVYGYDIKKQVAVLRKSPLSPTNWGGVVIDDFEDAEERQMSLF